MSVEETEPFCPVITPSEAGLFSLVFHSLGPTKGYLPGDRVSHFFLQSGLPLQVLSQIWNLADQTNDNLLDLEEFSAAVHLVQRRTRGLRLPRKLSHRSQWSHLNQSQASTGEFPSTGGFPSTEGFPGSVTPINESELRAYTDAFEAYKKTGYPHADASSVKELLVGSGLPASVLRLIWSLSLVSIPATQTNIPCSAATLATESINKSSVSESLNESSKSLNDSSKSLNESSKSFNESSKSFNDSSESLNMSSNKSKSSSESESPTKSSLSGSPLDKTVGLLQFSVACHLVRHAKKGVAVSSSLDPLHILPTECLRGDSLLFRKRTFEDVKLHEMSLSRTLDRLHVQLQVEGKRCDLLECKTRLLNERVSFHGSIDRSAVSIMETSLQDNLSLKSALAASKDSVMKNLEAVKLKLKTVQHQLEGYADVQKLLSSEEKLISKTSQKPMKRRGILGVDPFHSLHELKVEQLLKKKSPCLTSPAQAALIKTPLTFDLFSADVLDRVEPLGDDLFQLKKKGTQPGEQFSAGGGDPWTPASPRVSRDIAGFDDNFAPIAAADSSTNPWLGHNAESSPFDFVLDSVEPVFKTVSVTAEDDKLWSSFTGSAHEFEDIKGMNEKLKDIDQALTALDRTAVVAFAPDVPSASHRLPPNYDHNRPGSPSSRLSAVLTGVGGGGSQKKGRQSQKQRYISSPAVSLQVTTLLEENRRHTTTVGRDVENAAYQSESLGNAKSTDSVSSSTADFSTPRPPPRPNRAKKRSQLSLGGSSDSGHSSYGSLVSIDNQSSRVPVGLGSSTPIPLSSGSPRETLGQLAQRPWQSSSEAVTSGSSPNLNPYRDGSSPLAYRRNLNSYSGNRPFSVFPERGEDLSVSRASKAAVFHTKSVSVDETARVHSNAGPSRTSPNSGERTTSETTDTPSTSRNADLFKFLGVSADDLDSLLDVNTKFDFDSPDPKEEDTAQRMSLSHSKLKPSPQSVNENNNVRGDSAVPSGKRRSVESGLLSETLAAFDSALLINSRTSPSDSFSSKARSNGSSSSKTSRSPFLNVSNSLPRGFASSPGVGIVCGGCHGDGFGQSPASFRLLPSHDVHADRCPVNSSARSCLVHAASDHSGFAANSNCVHSTSEPRIDSFTHSSSNGNDGVDLNHECGALSHTCLSSVSGGGVVSDSPSPTNLESEALESVGPLPSSLPSSPHHLGNLYRFNSPPKLFTFPAVVSAPLAGSLSPVEGIVTCSDFERPTQSDGDIVVFAGRRDSDLSSSAASVTTSILSSEETVSEETVSRVIFSDTNLDSSLPHEVALGADCEELLSTELPAAELPSAELPSAELPSVKLPSESVPVQDAEQRVSEYKGSSDYTVAGFSAASELIVDSGSSVSSLLLSNETEESARTSHDPCFELPEKHCSKGSDYPRPTGMEQPNVENVSNTVMEQSSGDCEESKLSSKVLFSQLESDSEESAVNNTNCNGPPEAGESVKQFVAGVVDAAMLKVTEEIASGALTNGTNGHVKSDEDGDNREDNGDVDSDRNGNENDDDDVDSDVSVDDESATGHYSVCEQEASQGKEQSGTGEAAMPGILARKEDLLKEPVGEMSEITVAPQEHIAEKSSLIVGQQTEIDTPLVADVPTPESRSPASVPTAFEDNGSSEALSPVPVPAKRSHPDVASNDEEDDEEEDYVTPVNGKFADAPVEESVENSESSAQDDAERHAEELLDEAVHPPPSVSELEPSAPCPPPEEQAPPVPAPIELPPPEVPTLPESSMPNLNPEHFSEPEPNEPGVKSMADEAVNSDSGSPVAIPKMPSAVPGSDLDLESVPGSVYVNVGDSDTPSDPDDDTTEFDFDSVTTQPAPVAPFAASSGTQPTLTEDLQDTSIEPPVCDEDPALTEFVPQAPIAAASGTQPTETDQRSDIPEYAKYSELAVEPPSTPVVSADVEELDLKAAAVPAAAIKELEELAKESEDTAGQLEEPVLAATSLPEASEGVAAVTPSDAPTADVTPSDAPAAAAVTPSDAVATVVPSDSPVAVTVSPSDESADVSPSDAVTVISSDEPVDVSPSDSVTVTPSDEPADVSPSDAAAVVPSAEPAAPAAPLSITVDTPAAEAGSLTERPSELKPMKTFSTGGFSKMRVGAKPFAPGGSKQIGTFRKISFNPVAAPRAAPVVVSPSGSLPSPAVSSPVDVSPAATLQTPAPYWPENRCSTPSDLPEPITTDLTSPPVVTPRPGTESSPAAPAAKKKSSRPLPLGGGIKAADSDLVTSPSTERPPSVSRALSVTTSSSASERPPSVSRASSVTTSASASPRSFLQSPTQPMGSFDYSYDPFETDSKQEDLEGLEAERRALIKSMKVKKGRIESWKTQRKDSVDNSGSTSAASPTPEDRPRSRKGSAPPPVAAKPGRRSSTSSSTGTPAKAEGDEKTASLNSDVIKSAADSVVIDNRAAQEDSEAVNAEKELRQSEIEKMEKEAEKIVVNESIIQREVRVQQEKETLMAQERAQILSEAAENGPTQRTAPSVGTNGKSNINDTGSDVVYLAKPVGPLQVVPIDGSPPVSAAPEPVKPKALPPLRLQSNTRTTKPGTIYGTTNKTPSRQTSGQETPDANEEQPSLTTNGLKRRPSAFETPIQRDIRLAQERENELRISRTESTSSSPMSGTYRRGSQASSSFGLSGSTPTSPRSSYAPVILPTSPEPVISPPVEKPPLLGVFKPMKQPHEVFTISPGASGNGFQSLNLSHNGVKASPSSAAAKTLVGPPMRRESLVEREIRLAKEETLLREQENEPAAVIKKQHSVYIESPIARDIRITQEREAAHKQGKPVKK